MPGNRRVSAANLQLPTACAKRRANRRTKLTRIPGRDARLPESQV